MVRDFGGTNEHLGKSKYVIIEADEYKASFLNYKPKIIILTCIDEDHLDYYRDIHHIISVFHEFILRLPPDGLLIANADDPNIASLLKKPLPFSVVTYGIQHGDIRATSIDFRKKTTRFVVTQGSGYDHVEINLKGQHNILNTLGVYACARHCDITEKKLIRSLKNFKGANRRFDVVVSSKNITIIDDYAHHPTELKAFISALRQSYASKKILLVFQPHQEDRFTKLFVQFALSFNGVDKILLTEIYRVEGRSDSKDTSHRLAIELQSRGLNAVFASSFNVAVKEILREIKNYDVIAFVGAGDVIELRKLVQKELHI